MRKLISSFSGLKNQNMMFHIGDDAEGLETLRFMLMEE